MFDGACDTTRGSIGTVAMCCARPDRQHAVKALSCLAERPRLQVDGPRHSVGGAYPLATVLCVLGDDKQVRVPPAKHV